jgi:hypothetical protein
MGKSDGVYGALFERRLDGWLALTSSGFSCPFKFEGFLLPIELSPCTA